MKNNILLNVKSCYLEQDETTMLSEVYHNNFQWIIHRYNKYTHHSTCNCHQYLSYDTKHRSGVNSKNDGMPTSFTFWSILERESMLYTSNIIQPVWLLIIFTSQIGIRERSYLLVNRYKDNVNMPPSYHGIHLILYHYSSILAYCCTPLNSTPPGKFPLQNITLKIMIAVVS